jgi:hypothetical protein
MCIKQEERMLRHAESAFTDAIAGAVARTKAAAPVSAPLHVAFGQRSASWLPRKSRLGR